MKEKEIIKKLKSTDLPAVEMQSHRRRLKMALLAAGCPQKNRDFSLLFFKTITKGGIDIMMKGLLSKQPVWKTACIGIVGLALVIALSFSLPSLFTDSAYARAADIVRNSPEIKAVLGESDNGSLEIVEQFLLQEDGTITVVVSGGKAVLTADVDLEAEAVVEITPLGLTEAERQEAISIAEADLRVQELLEKGAVISRINYLYRISEDEESPGGEHSKTVLRLSIELDGEFWYADIDLQAKQVVKFEAQPDMPMCTGVTFGKYSENGEVVSEVIVTVVEQIPAEFNSSEPTGGIVISPTTRIAEADPAVKALFDKGAVIVAGYTKDSLVEGTGKDIQPPKISRLIIELDGQYWYVDVNLDTEQVIGLPVETDDSIFAASGEPVVNE